MKYYFVSYAFPGGFGRASVAIEDDEIFDLGGFEDQLAEERGDHRLSVLYYKEISEAESNLFERKWKGKPDDPS